jgi:hypothetical protein
VFAIVHYNVSVQLAGTQEVILQSRFNRAETLKLSAAHNWFENDKASL